MKAMAVLLVTALSAASCASPSPPVKENSTLPPAAPPAPARAPAEPESAPAPLSVAPPPVASAAQMPCEGPRISLASALASAACYVDAASVRTGSTRILDGIQATLESTPKEVKDHEYAWATYRLRNVGTERATLYFHPASNASAEHPGAPGSHLVFHFSLVDPRRGLSHDVAAAASEYFDVPEGGPKLARITIDPGGLAWLQLPWCARRTAGRTPRMTWSFHVPLDPGPYVLRVQTAERKLDPRDEPVKLLAGDSHSECHWPGQELDEHMAPRAPAPPAPSP